MAAPHPSTQGRRGSEREAPECGYPAIAASLTCTSQLPCSRAEAMRDGKGEDERRPRGQTTLGRNPAATTRARMPPCTPLTRAPLAMAPSTAVVVTFRNVGAAPALRQNKFKIDAEQPFQAVIVFLRKQLHTADTDSLFVYVNSAFAPSPDERIADVARCFHVDGGAQPQLLHYAGVGMTVREAQSHGRTDAWPWVSETM
eukprot:CAMPEP_0179841538 /NCGR_PEP_ID=MMETSP0982-20121206/2596_1 /TAXON_ID=483367 /ORGANISM="non described non described, Strain CCMP 2436" /LENGTH=199 /DNA_ID=CAMNT_0021725649 /DNA_START=53 /DNA_END=652 /DNA_ORIENTATION=-